VAEKFGLEPNIARLARRFGLGQAAEVSAKM